jgi:hypothetical protein
VRKALKAIFAGALSLLMMLSTLNMALGEDEDAGDLLSLGVGHVHMDTSCFTGGFQEL